MNGDFKILSRKKFVSTSTYPAEIIAAALENDQVVQLFCKHYVDKPGHTSSHRGGLEYEIKIYNEVLRNVPLSKPKFYNGFLTVCNEPVLVLEYLNGSLSLTKNVDPEYLLIKAASWIGNFHRIFENNAPSFATAYNVAYYKRWVEKVRNLTELKKDYPWLEDLCAYFSDNIPLLIRNGNTFIHGEFYPLNILVKENIIYPIDWESAAAGPGEIDLASLIEDWDEQTVYNATVAYKTARWPAGENIPNQFEKLLLLSQIYLKFRWMTEFIEWWKNNPREFQQLILLAKRTGYT